MKARIAARVSIVIPLSIYVLIIIAVGDDLLLLSGITAGREERAAVAIRDNVNAFYKWGTLVFTYHYLDRHYATSRYFTQSDRNDCKEEFVAALTDALERHACVDLFLLAHTNNYINWVSPLPEPLRTKIRFVYNTGCHNESQGQEWLNLGADAYIGHPGVSQSPFFYFYLLRHWVRGNPLQSIIELGNERMIKKFYQLERISFKRYDADYAIRESIASLVGNSNLRIQDVTQ